jgi:UDP-N-acetylglucosamine acyltransferase
VTNIHPQAIVDPSANIAEGVTIGPFSIIGADVTIGANSWVGPHVVINGPTSIGTGNRIFQFASLGEAPQDISYKGEATRLELGDNNVIREHVTISRGTSHGGQVTRVGSDNFIMAYTHIGHDCQVGNNNIFANGVQLGGHVHIGDHVNLAGMALIHQFVNVGSYSFCGMGAGVSKDVPPFVMVARNPAAPFGLNAVGLKRKGFDKDTIIQLKRAYKILYMSGLKLDEALVSISELGDDAGKVAEFIEFIQASKRSIIR